MSQWSFQPAEYLTFDTVESERRRFIASLTQSVASDTVCKLDLSAVKRCDSAGLALLIEAKRLCDHRRISLELYRMPDFMRSLAEFSDIDSFFRIL